MHIPHASVEVREQLMGFGSLLPAHDLGDKTKVGLTGKNIYTLSHLMSPGT